MRISRGPAAVTCPFFKKEPFWREIATVLKIFKDGKVFKRAGKSEDLPILKLYFVERAIEKWVQPDFSV